MEEDVQNFRRGGSSRIWKGLVLVGAGLLLLAYKMGAPIPHWIFTWPMILIVLGFLSGVKNRFHNPGSLIMIAVGVIFLVDQSDRNLNFHNYIVPALMITVGIVYIMRPRKWKSRNKDWRYNYYEGKSTDDPATGEGEEYIDVNAVFSGVKKNILSKNFKGGEINSFMGGSEINMLQANIQQEVVVEINNVFGGTKLLVPANWDVKNEVTAIFGGVEDKRGLHSAPPDPLKTLVIRGTCIFGGIEVANY